MTDIETLAVKIWRTGSRPPQFDVPLSTWIKLQEMFGDRPSLRRVLGDLIR